MRNSKNGWIVLTLAVAGVGICLLGMLGFWFDIVQNTLPWHPDQTAQDFYLAIGQTYSQGFAIGFFFCFCLSLAALGASAWLEHRRVEARRQKIAIRPARVHQTQS